MRRQGGREAGRDHMAAFLDSAGGGALCATSVPATVLRIYLQFLLGSRKVNIQHGDILEDTLDLGDKVTS